MFILVGGGLDDGEWARDGLFGLGVIRWAWGWLWWTGFGVKIV